MNIFLIVACLINLNAHAEAVSPETPAKKVSPEQVKAASILVKEAKLLVQPLRTELETSEEAQIKKANMKPVDTRFSSPAREGGNFIFLASEDPGGDIPHYKITLKHKKSEKYYDLGIQDWATICSTNKLAATTEFMVRDTGDDFEFYKFPVQDSAYNSLEAWSSDCKSFMVLGIESSADPAEGERAKLFQVILK